MAAKTVNELLAEEVPFCTGVVPLDASNSQLFHRNTADGSLGFIDFSTAVNDDAQLKQLAEACQPATFGVQQQDVLDESYRKAGTPSTFLPTSIRTILVLSKVFMTSFLKIRNRQLDYVYGKFCLVLEVKASKNRESYASATESG